MLIKNINFNNKKNLFNVNLDNETKFNISYELYEKLNLTVNQEIDTKIYNILEDEDIYQNCKSIAENYINYKMRTVLEVYKKIKQHTKKDSAIEKVINYYKKLDLLNDERYAEEYVKQNITYRNLSKKMIEFKLKEKGIDDKVSKKYLEEYDEEIEYENAMIIFKKKYKNEDLSDYKIKQKYFRFLSSKGFGFSIINRVLKNE
ncbi:regulatory protein RecX [Helcococcus bovis]|uniref:regulatory protein RecX n=1 Tax=Helcococcus bovis TaxID=3153252 RepID=UPI0038B979FC